MLADEQMRRQGRIAIIATVAICQRVIKSFPFGFI